MRREWEASSLAKQAPAAGGCAWRVTRPPGVREQALSNGGDRGDCGWGGAGIPPGKS